MGSVVYVQVLFPVSSRVSVSDEKLSEQVLLICLLCEH